MDITVTWLGHSCFRIEKDGFAVVIDPYAKGSVPGLKDLEEEADLTLKTHNHFDHNALGEIVKKENDAENPFTVEQFKSYHDSKRGLLRGKNYIIKLTDGEKSIVHMGDIGCVPSGSILEEIKGANLLLIPVGGTYTVTAGEAADLIKRIAPKAVIPMHYRTEKFGFGNLQHLDEFKNIIGDYDEKETYSVTLSELENGVTILTPKYSE